MATSRGACGGAQGTSGTAINWLLSHLELLPEQDLRELHHTSTSIDDLSRLVASSKDLSLLVGSSSPVALVHDQEASSTSANAGNLRPQFEGSADELRVPYVVEPAEPLQRSSNISRFSSKLSPGNISFVQPQSSQIEESTIFGYAHRKKVGTSIFETSLPDKQMQIEQKLLASMEDEPWYMDSSSYAGVSKQSFQDRYKKDYRFEHPLLGCDGDGFLPPQSEPAQHMQLHNFIGSADMTNTKTADASLLRKSEVHIQAERRRREKLNQRFVALSSILPGLKKMDKASILGDAIKYVQQLEQHLKQLEESKFQPLSAQNSYIKNIDESTEPPAAIDARAFGNDVLIRVHCIKIKNILVRCLEVLDRMPLSIVNANVLSFSDIALDLTFTAQIEQDSDLTSNDIVEALQTFFKQLQYSDMRREKA